MRALFSLFLVGASLTPLTATAEPTTTATTATSTRTPPRAGPVIDAPVELTAPSGAPVESLGESELGSGRRSTIGGYGEGHVTWLGDEAEANLKRFVLFVGHRFNSWAAVYSETEVEDAHELELEQAYVELTPWSKLGVRAGLVIVPLGLTNLHHEPPMFHGVTRPLVDQLIIPSTWRELGAGVFGEVVEGLRYQAYVMSGLRGDAITDEGGLAAARGLGVEAPAKDGAVAARLSWEATLGLELSLAGYLGGAGQSTAELGGVTVGMLEADARYKHGGLELKGELAGVMISDADRLTAHRRLDAPTSLAVPSSMYGFYVEAAYDVFFGRLDQELLPFVRFEHFDTRASRPAVLNAGEGAAKNALFVGLSYRPIPQLVFKADYVHFLEDEDEAHEESEEAEEAPGEASGFSLGVGFLF